MTGRRSEDARCEQRLVAALFVALLVALKFDVEIAAAVDCGEPLGDLARSCSAAVCQRRGQRAFVAAGEADQSGGELFKIFERSRALGLGVLAHLEARDELAEILIAGLRCAEQQQARRLVREIDAAARQAA